MRMREHLTTVLLAPIVLCRIVRNATVWLLNLSNLGEPKHDISSPIEPCYRFRRVMFQAFPNSWQTRLVTVSVFTFYIGSLLKSLV